MLKNFGQSKLFVITKHVMIFLSLLLMASLALMALRKDDARIPQKEIVIHLKIDDKLNICLPADEEKR